MTTDARPRRVHLDRLRGLAVLVMIEVHVTNALLAPAFRGTPAFRALDFVNGLVAPTFLFCAGVSARLTTHPLGETLRRSGVLLLLGYLLHASGALRGDWPSVLQADVLQVMALSLATVALVARVRPTFSVLTAALLAGVAAVVVGLTPWTHGLDTSALPAFARPYVNDSVPAQFPLFPWAAYVFAGAACSSVYPRYLALLGVLALGGGLAANVDPAVRFGLVALLLGALALIDDLELGRLDALLSLFGRRSLLVYLAHIAIVYGTHPLSLRSRIGATQGPLACAALWALVTASMALLAARAPRTKYL